MHPSPTEPVEPLVFSLANVAKALGLSRSGVHRLIASGEIQSFKLGKRRLVRTSDLVAFIDEQVTK